MSNSAVKIYGESGYSGVSGWSGTSGKSGYSGSGISGWSGTSGDSGTSGTSGVSGDSGTSGYSGSGISGWSGAGTSGWSGESGDSTSGWSGTSGYSGPAYYDIGIGIIGIPKNAEEIFIYVADRAYTVPQDGTGCVAMAEDASTGNVSFSMHKNNAAAFGTVVFNASATGSFTIASATAFAIGDILKVVAPSTADATLSNIGITLLCTIT